MAIDRTFNFGEAQHITEDDVDDFFNNNDGESLEEMGIPCGINETLRDLLNGELDHVDLRNAIEKMLESTITE